MILETRTILAGKVVSVAALPGLDNEATVGNTAEYIDAD